MMGCPPSHILKWRLSDVMLMLRYTNKKAKPNVQEIEDVDTMSAIFGAETHG
jgi:hypothetical protein